jgi:chromosome segregation ATPase
MSEQTAGKRSWQVPILFGVVLALVIANAIVFVRISNLRQDMAAMRDSLATEVAKVRQTAALSTTASAQHLDQLRSELGSARKQATLAAGQARTEALRHADQLARQLQEEQAQQQAQVNTQLIEVKEATSTANNKISDVSTDVSNVKTEVASTKSELDKTISELKSVRGDMGVQSGLIATNSKELTALRALGDRNYTEFKLARAKQFVKVGNVQMQLKKVDPKQNKYTLELVADDKSVEKRDKSLNEPVQFYMSGAHQPYEIVVNQLGKDQISGYLSAPKILQARN